MKLLHLLGLIKAWINRHCSSSQYILQELRTILLQGLRCTQSSEIMVEWNSDTSSRLAQDGESRPDEEASRSSETLMLPPRLLRKFCIPGRDASSLLWPVQKFLDGPYFARSNVQQRSLLLMTLLPLSTTLQGRPLVRKWPRDSIKWSPDLSNIEELLAQCHGFSAMNMSYDFTQRRWTLRMTICPYNNLYHQLNDGMVIEVSSRYQLTLSFTIHHLLSIYYQ